MAGKIPLAQQATEQDAIEAAKQQSQWAQSPPITAAALKELSSATKATRVPVCSNCCTQWSRVDEMPLSVHPVRW